MSSTSDGIAQPSVNPNASAADATASVVDDKIKPEDLSAALVCALPEEHLDDFLLFKCQPEQLPDISHSVVFKPEDLRFWEKHKKALRRRKKNLGKKAAAKEKKGGHPVFPGTSHVCSFLYTNSVFYKTHMCVF